MKNRIKQENGVTVLSVAISVLIIIIITSVLAFSAKDSVYIKSLTNLNNDIELLREKISAHYSQYGEIPASIKYNLPSGWGGPIGANDTSGEYYVIDLQAIDGLTLNYGEGYKTINSRVTGSAVNGLAEDDLYIINKNSHNIFYVKGVNVPTNGETKVYYTDEENTDTYQVALQEVEQLGPVTWTQNGTIITGSDGTKVEVGDKILNYDPRDGATVEEVTSNGTENGYGDQKFALSSYTGGWLVLGADDGQLIITTADLIKPIEGGYKNLYRLGGAKGYTYGKDELDKISRLYGQGTYADTDKTRGVNVNDINDVTGYDPTKEGNKEKTPCYKGYVYQYGNEVTYSWNTYQSNVKYESTVKSDTGSYSKFEYPNEDGSVKSLEQGESKKFTCTNYDYYPNTLTRLSLEAEVGVVKEGTKAYKALFQNASGANASYWLGSQYIRTNEGYVNFGMFRVAPNGMIMSISVFSSRNGDNFDYASLRPAVFLESEVNLKGDSSSGWTLS